MKQSLSLSDKQYKDLSKPLDNLYKLSSKHVSQNLPTTSDYLRNLEELTSTRDSIVNYMIKDEWDNSQAIQSRYTQADVDRFNNSLDTMVNEALIGAITSLGASTPLYQQAKKLTELYKVETPEDLYKFLKSFLKEF